MSSEDNTAAGVRLLREGRSDEDVERLTGLNLVRIVELRGSAAAGPPMQKARSPEINFVKNATASLAISPPVD